MAAPQATSTVGSEVAVAVAEAGAAGAIPSRTRTVTADEDVDNVVNEIVETGSVIVRPTSSGASLRSVVLGVVSSSSVACGVRVGVADPLPIRIVTPLTAGEPAAKVVQVSNDATNVYQLPDGRFEMYSVGLVEVPPSHPGYIAHDNCPGWLRVIDYYRSDDGLTFPERRRIIVADAQDPPDMQFYYLAVTHTPVGRLGMLGHYRVQAQTMDIECCFSADGAHWQRPARDPWLPRGKPGEPDSYGVYGCHALVERGGRWHLFYTGTNGAHNHKHSYGPEATVVMYATCDRPWL